MSSNEISRAPCPQGMEEAVIDYGVTAGIVWCTAAAPIYGAVNGYVLVPSSHPWHGLGYQGVDCSVHGGLTYDAPGPDGGTWYGFDTLHAGDVWPGSFDWERDVPWAKEWSAQLVAAEAQRLAAQAAEAVHGDVVDAEIVEDATGVEG